MAENKFFRAMGRRKTSTALVRLYPGKGEIVVNGKPIGDYFGREPLHNYIRQPLTVADRLKAYDIHANVKGGVDIDNLVVSKITVGQGPTLKRWRARARGMAGRINKRTSHITVEVKEI